MTPIQIIHVILKLYTVGIQTVVTVRPLISFTGLEMKTTKGITAEIQIGVLHSQPKLPSAENTRRGHDIFSL